MRKISFEGGNIVLMTNEISFPGVGNYCTVSQSGTVWRVFDRRGRSQGTILLDTGLSRIKGHTLDWAVEFTDLDLELIEKVKEGGAIELCPIE